MGLKDIEEGVDAATTGGGYINVEEYGVHYEPDHVGRGPVGDSDRAGIARKTSNGRLTNRITGRDQGLWIYDFSADYSVTGSEAQSRTQKEFYPRHFAQPRYHIKAQTFNEEQYLNTTQFIRRAMMNQLHAPLAKLRVEKIKRQDLLVLTLDDTVHGQNGSIPRFNREGRRVDRTHKGGYRGWKMAGYVESIATGAERFVNAPEIEFDFVVVNAEEGLAHSLDSLAIARKLAQNMGTPEDYRAQFDREPVPDPDVPLPRAFKQPKKKKATPRPDTDDAPQAPQAEPGQTGLSNVVEIGGALLDWLSE